MTEKIKDFFDSLRGKKVTVIGFGVSNRPLVKILLDYGADITVRDKNPFEKLDTYAADIRDRVNFILGPDYLSDISGEYVFRTPGMRPDIPELLSARDHGSIITSEMELFFDLCPCHKIAITGSDGKSTTTTLIYNFLVESGYKAYLGGNLGTPLLPVVFNMDPDDYAVVELSSFQLSSMSASADIAVITNITPNHLNWHVDMDEYIDAKKNVFRYQDSNGILVVNADNEITNSFSSAGETRRFSFRHPVADGVYLRNDGMIISADNGSETEVMNRNIIRLPGDHNVENYMTAIAATRGIVSTDAIKKVAKEFKGVEHRMEFVRTFNGVSYYNDSIASTPTRTIAGLKAQTQKIILIAGGKDKNLDYSPLAPYILEHVRYLILTGETSQKIFDAVDGYGYNKDELSIEFVDGFEDAVERSRQVSVPGDIVYLSPASTSFDRFNNFEERGRLFKSIVNAF